MKTTEYERQRKKRCVEIRLTQPRIRTIREQSDTGKKPQYENLVALFKERKKCE